jgi:glycosyltransferase involved in cell wall biosynthesis
MPKILAYVHAYVPDHNAGAETTLHDILKHLVEEGWEATVVLKAGRVDFRTMTNVDNLPDYYIDGVHVVPATDKRTLLHYLPQSDVTISHLECSERTHLLSKNYGIPTIHLVHNTHPLTVQWMSHADALIINTEWIANEEPFKSFPAPKMVLNPPINPGEYKTTRGKSITLVNLWEDKGARIFYELARRFPNLSFLGVKGGYGVQELEELPNVTIMEHTADMKEVYSQTKVILMPSKYESFGRVGVEAMASGIPTIAHPTPGLQESLGDSGTFADRDNPDEWETALRELLKPAKYGKMSKLAKARSETLEESRKVQIMTLDQFIPELIRIRKS